MAYNGNISLRSFGYAMKNSSTSRRKSLVAAVDNYGSHDVISRLEWLQSIHEVSKSDFLGVVREDLAFVRSRYGVAPPPPPVPKKLLLTLLGRQAAAAENMDRDQAVELLRSINAALTIILKEA